MSLTFQSSQLSTSISSVKGASEVKIEKYDHVFVVMRIEYDINHFHNIQEILSSKKLMLLTTFVLKKNCLWWCPSCVVDNTFIQSIYVYWKTSSCSISDFTGDFIEDDLTVLHKAHVMDQRVASTSSTVQSGLFFWV